MHPLGHFKLQKQKDILPTYYPKRTPDNSLIDWGLGIYELERFIRAVTKPFNGAFTYKHHMKSVEQTLYTPDSESPWSIYMVKVFYIFRSD